MGVVIPKSRARVPARARRAGKKQFRKGCTRLQNKTNQCIAAADMSTAAFGTVRSVMKYPSITLGYFNGRQVYLADNRSGLWYYCD